ncbi:AsmA family protein [Edaphobacter modestus]|uniref:AsmA protein n=1 Tax=Edaphobacter modestus TaxID=388466 RepID=A0A4Q7YYP8_9BACT|nr:AsmA family protein [Edaphobacter modestus]RZU42323.1 AsmA protein [Edaphobacter modestus]
MRQIYPSQHVAPVPLDASLQPGNMVEQEILLPLPVPPRSEAEQRSIPPFRAHFRRFRLFYLGILIVLLLIFVPPLVNIGRYQRRIATSIGDSLGRPVHLDRISLTLFPLPGFTIENLVVGENPAFGVEPIIRANSVRATLRIPSLWRRQVEFSTISFTDPSVNLVHTADGKWNIEGILLQASHIETAPTAQRHAGSAPRFPYIEATGARLNFKQEQEKLPFSLVDADFALWLPDPHQWHLRLRAHPTRTDSNVSDTGTIELESTLGAAPSLSQVPLNLQGQWRDAPLGEATRVLFGRDAGWRGEMNLSVNIRGTFGESAVTTRLHLEDARPSDFVPETPLSAQVECYATASGLFHAFEDVRCSWPPAASSHAQAVALTGTIPNVHRLSDSSLQLGTSGISASTLLSWLRATSPHVSPDIEATGLLTGSMTYEGPAIDRKDGSLNGSAHRWQGQFTLSDATLKVPSEGKVEAAATTSTGSETSADGSVVTLLSQDVQVYAASRTATHHHAAAPARAPAHGLLLAPTLLQLGGHDPATLEGRFDATGYTLHLTGTATVPRLQALIHALPPLGDGLLKALPPNHPATAPFHIDLTAIRTWRGPQTWSDAKRPSTLASCCQSQRAQTALAP